MQTPPIRLGFNNRDKVFFGKFKDPATQTWKTKFVPKAACSSEDEAKQWFSNFLNTITVEGSVPSSVQVKRQIHTLTSLYPLWADYVTNIRTSKSGDRLDPKTVKCWLVRARNYILSHKFASLPLTAETFTTVQIVDWLDWLKGQGLAKYTIKDIVQVGRTMLGDGRKRGLVDLPFNPFADEIVRGEVPVGETVAGKDNPIHLSKVEACMLIGSDSPKIPMWRKVKNCLLLTTGIRDGEAQGLSWNHVQKELLVIERQLKTGGECPTFGPPKRGSIRTLPLHKLAQEALTAWQKASKGKGDMPIFPSVISGQEGRYFRSDSADYFRQDLRAAGVSDQFQGLHNHTAHSCRRTFMTLLSDASVSDLDIGVLAGHSGSGVRRHYIAQHVDRFLAIIEKLPFQKVTLKL